MTDRVLFATSNPHKIDEVLPIIDVASVPNIDTIPEPVEDAPTFAGNARIKARAYAAATGQRCLAEDSGLEVDALDGRPGVHSARYAGHPGSRVERDAANNAKLLAEVAAVTGRAARFVCAMCLADPDGTIVAETRGTFDGEITTKPRGDNGFGYDPLLYLPDVGKTSAELTVGEKNARSHRGAAARAMRRELLKLR